TSHSRETSFSSSSSSQRPQVINDKRILEYHPVRSRSVSSFPRTIARPSTYSDSVQRHPSLNLRTSSGLFGSSMKSEPSKSGLWTPTSPSSAVISDGDDEEEEEETVSANVKSRRKRAVGLWRSWAGEQSSIANVNGG